MRSRACRASPAEEDGTAGTSSGTREGDCAEGLRQEAAGWVLGGLDFAAAQHFARHLPDCRPCRRAVDELQPAAQALMAWPAAEPSEHRAAAVVARIRRMAGSP
jgi:hypothetical protein